MVTRVLLITGARSLADDPAAEAWARGKIAAALVGVDLLIVGDAPGPDRWAMYEGRDLSHGVHVYWTRGKDAGWILSPDGEGEASYEGRWAPPGTPTGPLDRNAAMVATARANMLRGHTVSVLALLDGRKPAVVKPGEKRPTRGTEHTARLARAAGLTVDAQTWPKGATT
mgnify:FL=1